MTTLRQIVTDALRENGIIQVGTMPPNEEFDEGFRKLKTFITQLLGNEAGQPFTSVVYGTPSGANQYAQDVDSSRTVDEYYIPANVRVVANLTTAKTIYLEPKPQPGSRFSVVDLGGNFATNNLTVHANGQKIDGALSATLNEDDTNSEWFYREDLAEWVKVSPLSADSQSPFPSEFDEYLITSLAMRLNPRYQEQTAPETLQEWRRSKSQFRSRYRQSHVELPDLAVLYRYGFTPYYPELSRSRDLFNRGLVI